MSEERDLPSRFRPPRETPYIQKLRKLLDVAEGCDSGDFMNHVTNVRRHFAIATDDDLNDIVRLSVQRTPEKYRESFEVILFEIKRRRLSCLNEV